MAPADLIECSIEGTTVPGGNCRSEPDPSLRWRASLEESKRWLGEFEQEHGRKLRVLHVGNIANNAFLNAKFLRASGVDAEVLCYDYTHVMGSPEWEEVDLKHPYGDDFAPRFSPQDLAGYTRPSWFHQGPLALCHKVITAGVSTDAETGEEAAESETLAFTAPSSAFKTRYPALYQVLCTLQVRKMVRAFFRARRAVPSLHKVLTNLQSNNLARRVYRAVGLRRILRPLAIHLVTQAAPDRRHIEKHLRDFTEAFPERQDQLSAEDLLPFLPNIPYFREIFSRYDIIQLYSTDPIYGWLAGNKPYVAFEHGTLRDFTQGDHPVNRMTSMGYRRADHVFITNGDCLQHAHRIGVERYTPMIHLVDVEQHRQAPSSEAAEIKRRYGSDILLLCPLRHDWKVKGTDTHLRALPLIRDALDGRRIKLLLVNWGLEVERSRRLIKELDCEDSVEWLPPLCRAALVRLIQAADVVLDQIALPHFGATAPQSLAAGTPVISSYEPESTAWIVAEPAPILPAFTPAGVASAIVTALDPSWRLSFSARARDWIDRHHHPTRLVADHLLVYRNILGTHNV